MSLFKGGLMLPSAWGFETGFVRYLPYLTRALITAIPSPMNKQATNRYVPACTKKSIGHTPFLPDSWQHQTTFNGY
jgi:hypothetical protein